MLNAMKHTYLLTAALLLPTSAFAGEPVSAKAPAPYVEPEPACLTAWFLGAGADHLVDAEETYYNGHIGYDFGCGHALFLEVGFVNQSETLGFNTVQPPNSAQQPYLVAVNADIDIIPVTINYKYEYSFTDRFGFYIGAGIGASYIDTSVTAGGIGGISDDEWSFTAQAFAGLVYNVSESFEIYGGARYLWLDSPSVLGFNFDDLDDFGVGGGIRFNF